MTPTRRALSGIVRKTAYWIGSGSAIIAAEFRPALAAYPTGAAA